MKFPHPFRTEKENREKMKQEAKQIIRKYEQGEKPPSVDTKIIWYMLGGFAFVLILKLISVMLGV